MFSGTLDGFGLMLPFVAWLALERIRRALPYRVDFFDK